MHDFFIRLGRWTSNLVAHPLAFILATASVLVWAACGPAFHYSGGWQLVINTGTTILTFLMVFLLQNTQNRDSRAMHIKLDELLRAIKGARTELVDLENVTEAELTRYCEEFKTLHLHYAQLLSKHGSRIQARAESAEVELEPRKGAKP
jgi:low affinity Fe/Cu permease